MQINNSTSKEKSLYHGTLDLLGINESDTTTYSIVKYIRAANDAYRKVDSWIWDASSVWQYDDSNYETLPVCTSTLVADQRDYQIDTAARTIERIEILDSEGNYQLISQADERDIKSSALSEFYETSGFPSIYIPIGRSVRLLPPPASGDVTTAKGLKMYVSRDIEEFTIADTTKEPGFDNHFHALMMLLPAYNFCLSNGTLEKSNFIKGRIDELKVDLTKHYGSRATETRARIKPKIKETI